jgi:hypothetical protein
VPVTEATDLYGLALERFVVERTALAKVLRGDGRREEAKRVEGLRKPPIAAWAVNQLARTQRWALANLFAVGDELSRVHADLLDGRGDPGALRAVSGRLPPRVKRPLSAKCAMSSDQSGSPITGEATLRQAPSLLAVSLPH